MNKQELLKEIEFTKEHLATVEKLLEECKYARQKPEDFEDYWIVNDYGQVYNYTWTDNGNNNTHYKCYNCFQTREQAEAEAEKILIRRQLEDIARRLNKGEKIDWSNKQQGKYSLYLSSNRNAIEWYSEIYRKVQGTIYCLDNDFCDAAIQEIGEERLKKYLRSE